MSIIYIIIYLHHYLHGILQQNLIFSIIFTTIYIIIYLHHYLHQILQQNLNFKFTWFFTLIFCCNSCCLFISIFTSKVTYNPKVINRKNGWMMALICVQKLLYSCLKTSGQNMLRFWKVICSLIILYLLWCLLLNFVNTYSLLIDSLPKYP